ncbi:hypothetical protein ACFLR0_00790 [Candidatus Bipolaricaulota bacterium]
MSHTGTSDHALQQAQAQLESILELVEAMENAQVDGEALYEGESLGLDELKERAREWPLSVLVRSEWAAPDSELTPAEYEVLLCTGGPAVRLRGDLSTYGEPETAHLEYQDWFTAWDRLALSSDESAAAARFASLFWFGE